MKKNRTERKEKRKALRPWKGLTVWCIIFALSFSIFTPMFHILDNDFMLVMPGSTWKMKNADSSAIYYPVAFDDEAEALAYGERIARQVSEEGIVLLTNSSDALPLPQKSRISLFSTSSVNPVMGGAGSGRVDAGSSDTMKEAMEKEGFIVNQKLWDFYDAIPARDMRNNSGFSASNSRQYEAPWEDYTPEVLESFSDYAFRL